MLSSSAFVLVIISIAIIHCDGAPTIYTITKEQYTTIQIGWTRTQVINLIGSAGSVVSEAGTGSTAVVIVQYTVFGTTYGLVSFGFVGGNLVSKAEAGLDSTVNNKITLQQYKTIQIGWTQQQVTQLLGGPGNVVSQSGASGSSSQVTIVQYSGSQSAFSIASFSFMGGSLSGKGQVRLDTGVYTINKQQYTTIQIGWTRDQVTNLVGSAGSVMSEAGTGTMAVFIVQYTVSGTTYGLVSFGFVGGNLISRSEVGLDSTANSKITLQQYKTIQIGWTQQQVTQLLGGPGNVVSQSGASGSSSQVTLVQYSGSQSAFSIASFSFMGGSLSGKGQVGLDTGVYTITKQQYTTIQNGWTRDQVTNLVGSAGNVMSEAGTGTMAVFIVQYTVSGTTYGLVSFGFVGGNLISKSEVGVQ